HDFVSWDIIVGKDEKPIFLEANFKGAVWLYQLATERPLFGDLTEDIIQYVSSELNSKSSPRKKVLTEEQRLKKRAIRLQKRVSRLRKRNKRLRLKLEQSKS